MLWKPKFEKIIKQLTFLFKRAKKNDLWYDRAGKNVGEVQTRVTPDADPTLRRRKVREIGAIPAMDDSAFGWTKIRLKIKRQVEKHWVFTITAGEERGRQFLAATAEIFIGRRMENHIYIKDPKVSRIHAVIHYRGQRLFIEDLKSTNGTLVNGHRIYSRKKLASGDQITLGDTVIKVECQLQRHQL